MEISNGDGARSKFIINCDLQFKVGKKPWRGRTFVMCKCCNVT
jgi:hypothetical protein